MPFDSPPRKILTKHYRSRQSKPYNKSKKTFVESISNWFSNIPKILNSTSVIENACNLDHDENYTNYLSEEEEIIDQHKTFNGILNNSAHDISMEYHDAPDEVNICEESPYMKIVETKQSIKSLIINKRFRPKLEYSDSSSSSSSDNNIETTQQNSLTESVQINSSLPVKSLNYCKNLYSKEAARQKLSQISSKNISDQPYNSLFNISSNANNSQKYSLYGKMFSKSSTEHNPMNYSKLKNHDKDVNTSQNKDSYLSSKSTSKDMGLNEAAQKIILMLERIEPIQQVYSRDPSSFQDLNTTDNSRDTTNIYSPSTKPNVMEDINLSSKHPTPLPTNSSLFFKPITSNYIPGSSTKSIPKATTINSEPYQESIKPQAQNVQFLEKSIQLKSRLGPPINNFPKMPLVQSLIQKNMSSFQSTKPSTSFLKPANSDFYIKPDVSSMIQQMGDGNTSPHHKSSPLEQDKLLANYPDFTFSNSLTMSGPKLGVGTKPTNALVEKSHLKNATHAHSLRTPYSTKRPTAHQKSSTSLDQPDNKKSEPTKTPFILNAKPLEKGSCVSILKGDSSINTNAIPSTPSSLPNASETSADIKWTCPDCWVKNLISCSKCICCGANNPKQGNLPSIATSAAQQNIQTLNSPKPQAISTQSPVVSSKFNLYSSGSKEKKTNNLICNVCSHRNKPFSLKCDICQSPLLYTGPASFSSVPELGFVTGSATFSSLSSTIPKFPLITTSSNETASSDNLRPTSSLPIFHNVSTDSANKPVVIPSFTFTPPISEITNVSKTGGTIKNSESSSTSQTPFFSLPVATTFSLFSFASSASSVTNALTIPSSIPVLQQSTSSQVITTCASFSFTFPKAAPVSLMGTSAISSFNANAPFSFPTPPIITPLCFPSVSTSFTSNATNIVTTPFKFGINQSTTPSFIPTFPSFSPATTSATTTALGGSTVPPPFSFLPNNFNIQSSTPMSTKKSVTFDLETQKNTMANTFNGTPVLGDLFATPKTTSPAPNSGFFTPTSQTLSSNTNFGGSQFATTQPFSFPPNSSSFFKSTASTANTFSLFSTPSASSLAGSGAGADSGFKPTNTALAFGMGISTQQQIALSSTNINNSNNALTSFSSAGGANSFPMSQGVTASSFLIPSATAPFKFGVGNTTTTTIASGGLFNFNNAPLATTNNSFGASPFMNKNLTTTLAATTPSSKRGLETEGASGDDSGEKTSGGNLSKQPSLFGTGNSSNFNASTPAGFSFAKNTMFPTFSTPPISSSSRNGNAFGSSLQPSSVFGGFSNTTASNIFGTPVATTFQATSALPAASTISFAPFGSGSLTTATSSVFAVPPAHSSASLPAFNFTPSYNFGAVNANSGASTVSNGLFAFGAGTNTGSQTGIFGATSTNANITNGPGSGFTFGANNFQAPTSIVANTNINPGFSFTAPALPFGGTTTSAPSLAFNFLGGGNGVVNGPNSTPAPPFNSGGPGAGPFSFNAAIPPTFNAGPADDQNALFNIGSSNDLGQRKIRKPLRRLK